MRAFVVCVVLFMFLTGVIDSSSDTVPNICELPGVPMFCNCDETGTDEATYVSCFVSTNITQDDPHWRGFHQQKNTKSLVFNSRSSAFLTYVPGKALRSLPHLQHVMLSEASIPVLTSMSFSNLSVIRSINAESNEIVDLEPRAFAFLPLLMKLELSDNKIMRLSAEVFEDVPSLETLYLENNELIYIDDGAFSSLPSLKELDLFNNHIQYLGPKTLVGLGSLLRLDMSRNNLTSLGDGVFIGTPQLRDLELSQNRLREISKRAFDDLPHLMNLRLKDNLLTMLPDQVFLGSPHILSLLLTDNRLTAFPETILNSLNNRTEASFAVYIKGNPLFCSCDLLWVVDYSRQSKNVIFREEMRTLLCVTDEDEKVNAVEYLTSDDLDCSKKPVISHKVTTTNKPSLGYDEDKVLNDDDHSDDDDDNSDEDEDDDNDVDSEDHSITIDDDLDLDIDDDEDDYPEAPLPPPQHVANNNAIPEVGKSHRVIGKEERKEDVSLSSKSQPSAADGEEASNVSDMPDNASYTLMSSSVSMLCLIFLAIR